MAEVDVAEVAGITGDSEEEVLRKGLESYISREVREAKARVKEIEKKYGVDSSGELEEKIESGKVDEHPAWEELIEWRNLEKRIRKLERY